VGTSFTAHCSICIGLHKFAFSQKTLIEEVVVILKLSAVLQNQDRGKLQEQPRVFDECVLDLWEIDTNQGQHDVDIAHKKFISTASNTPAIGVQVARPSK
jgi:hypothetical protein